MASIKMISGRESYFPDEILNNKRKNIGLLNATVSVPGSKSVTNRALLLAALSDSEVELDGVLFSDDSRHFLGSLISLGFEIEVDEENKRVKVKGNHGVIPNKNGTINVGSAGTAARFLTAMLALSDGEYTINCSEQMEKRPMQTLFEVLEQMGAEFIYLNKQGYLPVRVRGNLRKKSDGVSNNYLKLDASLGSDPIIKMDISKSTQFLSAMLMVVPVMTYDVDIVITSEKKTGAYIKITMDMLKEFGVEVMFDGESYHIKGNQHYVMDNYVIEPDVSAACYFFATAAITGGSVKVRNLTMNSMQGDMKFLEVMEKLGCEVTEEENGIRVTGPVNGVYAGIDIDMNNFSDQALTMSVVAAFATSETRIRNIGHIRGQECDRMNAIVSNLKKCGIEAREEGDDIVIAPREAHGAVIDTFEDHRVAMSFTLMGLKTEGIVIDNPMCCRKTFENFYDVFEGMFENS